MIKAVLAVVLLVAISLFKLPVFVYAADEKSSKLTTSFDVGEKFTEVFGYEESDLSDDIRYWRDQASFNQKVDSNLSYTVTQLLESRDFDNYDLYDNEFTQTAISSVYKLPKSESFMMPKELRTSYMYKHKDYTHNTTQADNNDYTQNKFSLGVSYVGDKDNWRIDYDTGVNVFDYSVNSINNESKVFNQVQLKKKLLDNKLSVFTGYKIQYAYRKNNDDRTEPEESVGFDFQPKLKYLSRISSKFETGKSETREEEVRDDIRDYKYERVVTTIDSPLTPKLSNSFTHRFTERKYANWNKSYHQLRLDDTIRYSQIDDKIRSLFYDATLEYKESGYPQAISSNTIQKAAGLFVTYDKKKDWKIKPGFVYRLKKFQHLQTSDTKRYIYTLGLEKTFNPDLFLAFDYRFEFRNYYRGAPDRSYESYKVSLNYLF